MIGVADLAARLDLKRTGREWRGTCPACGYGGGAFVLTTGKGGMPIGRCASCQDRDAIADVTSGGEIAGPVPRDTEAGTKQKVWKQERALSLWRGSEPATGTLADLYLIGRGLPGLAASNALRFRGDCPHPERATHPALIALVCDVSGAPLAVHRTFLNRDGRKASIETVRASLGPIWGGMVRLNEIECGKPLVIGEGIESSASAGRLIGLPAWAAISAGNLAKGLTLPSEARRVVIAADPDAAGRNAARDAWTRWTAEGRDVEKDVAKAHKDGCPPPLPPDDAPPEPMSPRLKVNDVTIERVATLAARACPKGLLIVRDELAGFLLGMNAYNDSGRQFWLETWNGASYQVERQKNPEPIRIKRLAVAAYGSVQPARLAELIQGAHDGLFSRFLWFWPDPIP
jgi:putative DNA primase/helicase